MGDIDRTVDDIKADARKLTDLGVPIGWPSKDERRLLLPCSLPSGASATGVPKAGIASPDAGSAGDAARPSKTELERLEAERTRRSDLDAFCLTRGGYVRPSLGNIFWLLLGGLLIGLGSPFWVKVIHAITPMKDVAGKIGEVLGTTRNDGTSPAPAGAGTPTSTSTAVEAFRVSSRRGPT